MGLGAVHRLLIFDSKFACRLDREWKSAIDSPLSGTNALNFPVNPTGKSPELTSVESMQLIMGMTYSLKNILQKLSPPARSDLSSQTPSNGSSRKSSTVTSPISQTEPTGLCHGESCFSYVTSKYRLSYFESPTHWKIVLLTDPAPLNPGEIEQLMRLIYSDILVRNIVQNPVYRLTEASFHRPGLLARIDEFFTGQGLTVNKST